jgi:hypothetical protein
MSRKSVSIEHEVTEWEAQDILVNELIHEWRMLKNPRSSCQGKAKYIAAMEIVLEYFNPAWPDIVKKQNKKAVRK